MKIYLNGQIIDEKDAKISVLDRGYLFGEGVFETFRSYAGKIPFLDKHLARMEWSATFIGIPFVHTREISDAVHATLKANEIQNARIKVVLTCQNDTARPALPSIDTQVNLTIFCESFKSLSNSEYEEGVNLAVIHSVKNDAAPMANFKSLNYLTKMVARKEFSEKSAFDGVLLDHKGYVTETSAANLFWIEGETLMTASVEQGLLPGITRDLVIQAAKEDGIVFKEKMITPKDLKKADEIFITGSSLEVMPVVQIDDDEIADGKPGKMTKEIRELYKQRVQEELEDL